jgi:peptide/nickel transport system ATP-binding protein
MSAAPKPAVGDTLLAVEDLSVAFGGVPALKSMSYTVHHSQTLAVVGESGSGKSVSALAMMGLLPPTANVSGRIRFDGKDLLRLPEREMRKVRGGRISMIFQEPMTSLNPVQRVGNQIAEAVRYHRGLTGVAAMDEARRLMERVGIPDVASRINAYPHTFSGGMRQRVMIAMALASNPALLIADEPTTALDVTIQAQILELMREIQRDTGVAILFITHDMGVVAEIADDVLVMKAGDLIEHGPVAPIFNGAKAEYTRSLIAAVPQLASGLSDTLKPLPPPREAEILSVDRLTVRFPIHGGLLARRMGTVHAVEDVSLSIRAGETLGLVGESGSGKSTIGWAIMNLQRVHSGTVSLAGKAIDYASDASCAALRRDVQMIFQDPYGSLDGRQTVGDAIMEPILFHRLAGKAEARDRMRSLLDRVGLSTKVAQRYPHEFSGGQRQRICIARAGDGAEADHRGRGGFGSGCHGQSADHRADDRAAGGVGDLVPFHQPRHRGSRAHMPSRRGYALRRDRRARPARSGDRHPAHDYTRRLLSAVPVAHPDLRGTRKRILDEGKRPPPVRPKGYVPPEARWGRVGADHLVREVAE